MSGSDRGEFEAWIASVVQRYEGSLIRYAAQFTGDADRARDVVQDAFLRLCREDRARVDGHLAQWLFTVCRNRALDVQRKEKRMKTITESQAAAHPDLGREQDRRLEQQDSLEQVERVLSTLSENQQEVVRLKFQGGLSYREISEVTELSVTNVGFLLHTALKKIREKLQAEGALV
ncbi:MAG: sigma-70 family RNA polymerase sigma factor [Planctomycetes bacterium]|nr:sigma-70 family RNA polymerase sigma factor [Planctomycetota bacterium]